MWILPVSVEYLLNLLDVKYYKVLQCDKKDIYKQYFLHKILVYEYSPVRNHLFQVISQNFSSNINS